MKFLYNKSGPVRNACLVLALAIPLPSLAQETTVREKSPTDGPEGTAETTTTTATGTITDFGGDRIVVRTESSAHPVPYTYSKTTTYVDEAGDPVAIETVKSGLPVIIHYVKDGDAKVARKVVVKKRTGTTPAADTGTITATGIITEMTPDSFLVRAESSKTPIRYKFTKATTYFDGDGRAATVRIFKSGLPVTVFYTKTSGDEMVATKVVLKNPPPAGTTFQGTVTEFSPERIIVRSESSPEPMTFAFSKMTTCVDEAGAPVSVELIKSGVPVTVYYTEGDSRVAAKVVVRKEIKVQEK